MSGDHSCFTKADEKLAPKNTRLGYMFGISPTNAGTFLRIATEKVDPSKRGRPINMAAIYCPFCGKKL